MSARIVITSFGSYGDLYPYIGLGVELKARGHDPVLAVSEYYRATVEREGLGFHSVRPDIDPNDREIIRRIMDPARGTEVILKELLFSRLRESYADLAAAVNGAHLLVSHPITFAAPIVAAQTGLPWVSTVLAPMSFFSKHDLPVFPPMPWAKRLERIPGASAALVGLAKRITRRWSEPVYGLRQELGLPRGGDPIFEGQHSPTLVLALFSRMLGEPQPDWPANVQITGAIPYNGPATSRPLSPELKSFLEAGPPPLVFTLGTSAVGAAGNFYITSIEAVRRLGVRAVLLVGSHADNRPPGVLPDDVLLVDAAPHAALFPCASVIVHQGGAGTLHQALRSGRPSLIVPFAHDQPDNAYRAARLGVARVLRPGRYTVRRARNELEILTRDPIYRRRADEVAERVRAEESVHAASDAIGSLLTTT